MTNDESNLNGQGSNVRNGIRFGRLASGYLSVVRHSAILCCVIAGVCVQARADDASLLSPTPTRKNGVSIALPKGWKVQDRDSSRILLAAAAASQDSDTTGDYQAGLTITSDPGSSIDGDAQQARLGREISNYEVTEKPHTLSINGVEAVTFGGTFTVGSLKLRCQQYLMTQNNRIYTLTVTALASHWDQYEDATRASVLTFTPTDKK